MSSIPPFTADGLLPPYLGVSPAVSSALMSPYRASIVDVVTRLSASAERRAILGGLLRFRQELHNLGIVSGFQWLDGSFVEDIDKVRPPGDIDVVTFFYRPAALIDPAALDIAMQARSDLFDPGPSKSTYRCDAFFVDLNVSGAWIASQTRYWFGLFSHTRGGNTWKGMLEVPLGTLALDQDAAKILGAGVIP